MLNWESTAKSKLERHRKRMSETEKNKKKERATGGKKKRKKNWNKQSIKKKNSNEKKEMFIKGRIIKKTFFFLSLNVSGGFFFFLIDLFLLFSLFFCCCCCHLDRHISYFVGFFLFVSWNVFFLMLFCFWVFKWTIGDSLDSLSRCVPPLLYFFLSLSSDSTL